ncbi:MAG: hypothetical protein M1503_10165 [Thaumarchaeota archaeon]|nr:hypothetical protein [Nitrososphaerota archaeon]MCL5318606.1 hypothetical protein [Nitrososphaerota archaeon]
MTYRQIVQKIIDSLNADASMKDAEQAGGPGSAGMMKWHFGRPVNLSGLPTPFGYVQFNGRDATGHSNVSQILYDLRFEIGIVDQAAVEDDAEKSVYDKIESVETVLLADKTLGGLVDDEGKTPYAVQVFDVPSKNYARRLIALNYVARRWMS